LGKPGEIWSSEKPSRPWARTIGYFGVAVRDTVSIVHSTVKCSGDELLTVGCSDSCVVVRDLFSQRLPEARVCVTFVAPAPRFLASQATACCELAMALVYYGSGTANVEWLPPTVDPICRGAEGSC
jgi:hypothetical protein